MTTLITVIHVITCILLVLVILLQSGKGAEISASFSGSSQTVFGSSGGANFFVRFTQGAAAVFMVTSVVLTLLKSHSNKSVFEGQSPTQAPAATAPVAPGAPPAAAAPSSPVGTEKK